MRIYKFTVSEDGKEEAKIFYEIDANELGHEICQGIRMGLFGIQADERASIKDNNDTSDALHRIAESLGSVADALREQK